LLPNCFNMLNFVTRGRARGRIERWGAASERKLITLVDACGVGGECLVPPPSVLIHAYTLFHCLLVLVLMIEKQNNAANHSEEREGELLLLESLLGHARSSAFNSMMRNSI
jgi:hypothetical protein